MMPPFDASSSSSNPPGAFLFGYPHLLPRIQGESLATLFTNVRTQLYQGGIIVMDLNGVPETSHSTLRTVDDLKGDKVIGAALSHVDILHMNEEELVFLTGCELEKEDAIQEACSLFLKNGVAILAVTRGSKGSILMSNTPERFSKSPQL